MTALLKAKASRPVTFSSWQKDWNAWTEKYIAPGLREKQFDLVVETLGEDVFSFPLVTEAFSEDMIRFAEKQEKWTTDRHKFYPTTDVTLKELGLDALYSKILAEFAHPVARWVWGLEDPSWISDIREENFMARYRAQDQQHLSVHHDYAEYTFTVGLNTDFEGGGTYFPHQEILGNPRGGYATLFPSITHPHGGRPTTKGTRYIIVSFCSRKAPYAK
ncbi:MAG: 2OG-Fe(II) oxygenase [Gammaproteobacteria bacterium]|nr:2OG-Fe(II) oxygenase [Gammaproteobacteria bacterium]